MPARGPKSPKRPPSRKSTKRREPDVLATFHPIVREWFTETLGVPSAPQRMGWPSIASGEHTLVLAPTGTGKTLAAFLYELDRLIVDGLQDELPNAVQILYISPLKALNNDIHRNLERPLAELRDRFGRAELKFPEIRVAVRTGDTPPSARARMLRKSPHILITTPESLHILLTSVRGRGMFSDVRAVIVDEIHAVAGTKRGAHLALTLERLEALTQAPPQRIGLSATQKPLEEIGRFLGGVVGLGHRDSALGSEDGDSITTVERQVHPPAQSRGHPAKPRSPAIAFRPVSVIDCGLVKPMELSVVSPVADLGDVGGTVWPKVVELALSYIRRARTTLVFVNNRAQAERIASRVNALAGEAMAQPYHGSLARERRLALEQKLKAGELPALVATSSLELGIDIGSVDLVMQLQSPKRVSAGLQRVGRAGHSLEQTSRGVLVPTFRDDLVEIAAIAGAMKEGDVEPTIVPQNALDVLAQVIVAAVSVDDWNAGELLELVRRAYPYHRLTRAAFDEVLAMLSGKYPSELASELEPRITWDRVTDRLAGSNASRMMAVISGGTIPDRGLYTVNLPDRTRLGELDEEFVHESRVGDVFQLGSATWRIGAIEHDRVIVTPAPGAPARMPFWHGEYATRSIGLSRRLGALRREVAERSHDESLDAELAGRYGTEPSSAWNLREYIAEQRAVTGVVPDDRTIVIEHFRDELGAVRLVMHSIFGGRVNAPWGMALAQRLREALGGVDVQVQTTDDGIMFRLPDLGASPPVSALLNLGPEEAERRVLEEVGASPLFGARFRMNAARALLLPRGSPRRRMPLWLQRLKALDLLETVRQFPSFPILVETYREVLQDAFDMRALTDVLRDIAAGRIGIHQVELERPSPFAASLQFGFVMDWLYADDTPRAERAATLLSIDRVLLDEIMLTEGADEETYRAIGEVLAERRGTALSRGARTADELALLLDRAGDLEPEELRARVAPPEAWRGADPMHALLESGRAVAVPIAPPECPTWRVILTENFGRYVAAFGAEALSRVRAGVELVEAHATAVIPAPLRLPAVDPRVARREILARWLALSGPVSADDVRARYGWEVGWIERRLTEWERSGRLMRGRYRAGVTVPEWLSRRVVETARRRALAALRKQIEAVELPSFAAFLQRWQHVDPRHRLEGASGVEIVVRQLQGLARPAEGWERDYLTARLRSYDPQSLALLAGSGRLTWIGGSRAGSESEQVVLATIRFVERGEASLWMPDESSARLSENATDVRDVLSRFGASFLQDLQASTGLGMLAVRDALRELAAAGLVTNDTVEAMREVIRMRPLPDRPRVDDPDPTRWLPAGFTPSPGRPVVQRRPDIRRLPKWRRPDLGGPISGWIGRWALLRVPGTWGERPPEEEHAEYVARQWLSRYGVVTRDWWQRERPPVSWRAIYRELKRLEYRGEVRRGYFVRGLGGAQFALPDAVERLREARDDHAGAPLVVMSASDPANPYSLPLEGVERDPITRPRGTGALLVTRNGRVLMAVEARGARITLTPGVAPEQVTAAASEVVRHMYAGFSSARRRKPILVRLIDEVPANASAHVDAFAAAGFRRATDGLQWWGETS